MSERIRIDVVRRAASTLAEDVRRGMSESPRRIPPKHFYDAHGSELFDRICHLPEYYLMRCELEILEAQAASIARDSGATALVEIGSGVSRKTRTLLDALVQQTDRPVYMPFDLSESTLRAAAVTLAREYPLLRVHGVVADFEQDLAAIPRASDRQLVAFLGSTIGNFAETQLQQFLRNLSDSLGPGDHVLIGFDLLKEPAILVAAYNDAQGVTAEFNKNVLRVINRELRADFDVDSFEHVAFFNPECSRIEMHLRALRAMRVACQALSTHFDFVAGEMIHTENSRKFTRQDVEVFFNAARLRVIRWDTSADNWFAVALGTRV